MTDERKPETRGRAEVSAKFVDEAEAAAGVHPSSASVPDDPLLSLRAERERLRAGIETTPEETEEDKALWQNIRDVEIRIIEARPQTLLDALAQIETLVSMAHEGVPDFAEEIIAGMDKQIPARIERLLAASFDDPEDAVPAVEDPVLALKREWEARYQALDEQRKTGDDSDEARQPFYDRLYETEVQILRTPATTLAGVIVKLVLWARLHCSSHVTKGSLLGWNHTPMENFSSDQLPVASALQDLERLARTPAVVETPPAEDTALIDALAEYDRLTAIGQGLERRTDVFRPDTPEAKEATEAYQAACDKAMEAWEKVRAIPAMTPAGLLARLQATDRYMTDFGEDSIYAEDWCVIKADVQRVAGETSPPPLDGETVVRVEELANEVIDLNQGIRRLLNCDLEEIPTTGQVLTLEIDRRLARLINLLDGENEEALS